MKSSYEIENESKTIKNYLSKKFVNLLSKNYVNSKIRDIYVPKGFPIKSKSNKMKSF